jgi:uncharacterized repeat protein (TIGR03803 family)
MLTKKLGGAMERLTIVAFTLFSTLLLAAGLPAQAQTETILYNFSCHTDGCPPQGVVVDENDNLYGTTFDGGSFDRGAVFELTSSGAFTTLYSFTGGTDGSFPYAGVVLDSKGNLYGTTSQGGVAGYGTIFKVTLSGTETVLHSFSCGSEPCYPQRGVVLGPNGSLFGTAYPGGTFSFGSVFELTASGTFTTLYSFRGGTDGNVPNQGIVLDKSGNVYGTTDVGGTAGFGTVFKVSPSGTETVLHSFAPNGKDGFYPAGGVTLDSKDDIYGTTASGGAIGVGTVFKVTPSGTETLLHSLTGGKDGINPEANLVFDKNGNLYGTTAYGGSFDLGMVFELTPSGVETTLHSFADNGTDGYFSFQAGLTIDKSGNLYGTTQNGGTSNPACTHGCGVVFKIVP